MEELLEWVRATLPMDLETPRLIEEKIESMLEKEKEIMCDFAFDYNDEFQNNGAVPNVQEYYNETFNTKEK